MVLENLKENIEREKKLAEKLNELAENFQNTDNSGEKKNIPKAIDSLIEQIKILNNSIPGILNSISPYKGLKQEEKVENLVKLSYPESEEKVSVTIEKKDKEKFLEKLSLNKQILKRLTGKAENKEDVIEFKKSKLYARTSNRFFQDISGRLIEKGHFKDLNLNLRKANMPYLLVTYLSMTFFSASLAAIIAVFGFIALFFLLNTFYSFLILLLPFAVLFSFIYYPSAERKSIENNINQEIPFVTIHMSAIAGSGIEPSQIFKIVALGEEYPYTKNEIRKVINQVNIYGYDLVTALKNIARETSSKKLGELLNGMASAISGGSELSSFLDKRAETLLFEYKLERERYTKSAETFMDIYISVMIAAPMIMTLLLVLISISGISIAGLSLNQLTTIIVSVVSLINIVFLAVLQLNQPTY